MADSAVKLGLRSPTETRAVTSGPLHHFFGYYGIQPWDAAQRYLLSLEVPFFDRPNTPDDVAVIGRIDLQDGNRWEPITETNAWNWQQGSMMHWLQTAPDRLMIHNDRRDDAFVSVIRDLSTGTSRVLPRSVVAVSRAGTQGLSINMARLHAMRPGYGYVGLPDPWAEIDAPEDDGIYLVDFATGAVKHIVSYAQVVDLIASDSEVRSQHDDIRGCKVWFNHLYFNTDDSRFVFLARWVPKGATRWTWLTAMLTANLDGSDLYLLSNRDMVSHYDWRNTTQILAFAHTHEHGNKFCLFNDRSQEVEIVGDGVLPTDGHCSYSPDGNWVLNDTYPDAEEKRTLMLFRPADNARIDLGRFLAPRRFAGEIRCDLHPRWSRDGRQISFDSLHEGTRQVYVMDVGDIVD